MAQQRERRPLQEFVKFLAVGAAVVGRIVRNDENDNGRFVILSPVGYRPNGTESFMRYDSLAVGLATDLARQIAPGETGAVVLIHYVGTRPTAKASPMKLFEVFELTAQEARDILAGGKLPQAAKRDDDDAQGVVQDDLF